MSAQSLRIARCACGQVGFELRGAPIVTVACYCDDCQAGAHQLAAAHPQGMPVMDASFGTPGSLYRRDRVRCVAGEDFLRAHKLRPGSVTERVVASCCGTPMLVRFTGGGLFWVDVYSTAMGDDAPPITMRLQTQFMPESVALLDNVPAYRWISAGFAARLVLARAAMLLGR